MSLPCSTQVKKGTQKAQRGASPPPKRSGTQRVGRGSGTQRSAAAKPGKKAAAPRSGPGSASDQSYLNLTGYPFPLGPITRRATIRKELVRGTIWGFEQPQSLGGSNVTANVRMTIVRLQSGGLWVHAPIAPTREWPLWLCGATGAWRVWSGGAPQSLR